MIKRPFSLFSKTSFRSFRPFSVVFNYEAIEFPLFPHFSYESPENLENYTNVKLNHPKDVETFLTGVENFIFDCDGVIYEGDKILKNAIETIGFLRNLKKKIFFLTNASNITRKQFLEKLLKKGVQTELEEVYCASYLSAQFFKKCLPNIHSVYLIGNDDFKHELINVGLNVYGGDEDNTKIMNAEIFRNTITDPEVEAVIIGEDERFNYYKLNMASLYLHNNKNCILFAANIDNYDNINKRNYSSSGPLVAAIEAVSGKKCKHTAGKPSSFMMKVLSDSYHKLDKKKTCMVGDRLNTDVAFAKNSGILSLLLLSGVTKSDYFNEDIYVNKNVRPNYVMTHLGRIYEVCFLKK